MEDILGTHGIIYRCNKCKTLQRLPMKKGLKSKSSCLKCGQQNTLERCTLHVHDGLIEWVAKSDPLPNLGLEIKNKEGKE